MAYQGYGTYSKSVDVDVENLYDLRYPGCEESCGRFCSRRFLLVKKQVLSGRYIFIHFSRSLVLRLGEIIEQSLEYDTRMVSGGGLGMSGT